MEYLIIALFLIIILVVLGIVFKYDIKKIKKIAESKELDLISSEYPSNKEICTAYLEILDNRDVKIEEDDQANNCLYIAISNKILIANMRNSYTRIQTIAHECIHSVQDKTLLMFNFIFSNIYLIYFVLIAILGICGIISNKIVFLSILFTFSMIYLIVRIYLENDAMIKAKYLAKEYMEANLFASKEENKKIIDKFDSINKLGIKSMVYNLFMNCIIKIIIICVIFGIF